MRPDAGAGPAHMATGAPPSPGFGALIDELRAALSASPQPERMALRGLLAAAHRQSFPMFLLLFALLLVSPLSAIPGATSLFGLAIATIMAQQLLGRDRVWLPRILLDRTLPVRRTLAALDWMKRPVAWFEARLRPRLDWAVHDPFARLPMALVLLASLCAPLMEVIPGSGTSVGAAIALFSAGMLARDGLFVLAGAILAALLPLGLWLLVT